jgi:electron transfer flavoprotein beta subunit
MLIISLTKGVPARTTRIVTAGGLLRREEMELVMNPHDSKAIEAADFAKRRAGGKVIALSMGPESKLAPILSKLYDAEVLGADETYMLSDPRMAGSDTLATAYTVSLGIIKLIDRHASALDELVSALRQGSKHLLEEAARKLYLSNLLPNKVYSTLPAVRGSLVQRYLDGKIEEAELEAGLREARNDVYRFLVLAGIKSTDGETGSVGPQVAEALSEHLGFELPHATYVEDFDIDPVTLSISALRKVGRYLQRMELSPPAVLTINTEYRPRGTDPRLALSVRAAGYFGKVDQPKKFTAQELEADPTRLGLAGSPTIVGPGLELGRPPVQKYLGKSTVFLQRVEGLSWEGKSYPPFERGDLAVELPERLLDELKEKKLVGTFNLEMLTEELFGR